jgi:hypothetical protein
VRHTYSEMQRWHNEWLKWHDDNVAYVAELEEKIRRLSMKTEYLARTFRSVEEFHEYLSVLPDGWELHSFCPGVVQMIIAVFRKSVPLVQTAMPQTQSPLKAETHVTGKV